MKEDQTYKVHKIFPKISFPPWLHQDCENMVSNSEQVMEKTRKFQIVYVARTNLCKQTNWPCQRPYETGVKRVHVNSPNVKYTVFQTF